MEKVFDSKSEKMLQRIAYRILLSIIYYIQFYFAAF